MLCGFPPFRSDKAETTYKLIRDAKIDYPKHMDPASKDLIGKLVVPSTSERLGAKGKDSCSGAEEVKKHKFFRGVDWFAMISRSVPPPKL